MVSFCRMDVSSFKQGVAAGTITVEQVLELLLELTNWKRAVLRRRGDPQQMKEWPGLSRSKTSIERLPKTCAVCEDGTRL